MPRRPPRDGADRHEQGDHERRLECEPDYDEREAERGREAQADAQRARLRLAEAVALRLEIRMRPAHAQPTGSFSCARFHSGTPSASRRAERPEARKDRTASCAYAQNGPRQYAITSTSPGSSLMRCSSSASGIELAPSM